LSKEHGNNYITTSLTFLNEVLQMRQNFKCTTEMHNRCENSALCHLCDGESLYKNTREEKQVKMQQREANKQAEKDALLKVHKKEKKEGMAFEKRVASQWNNKFGGNNKKKVAKPRLDMLIDDDSKGTVDPQPTNVPVYKATPAAALAGGSKGKSNNKTPRPEAQRQFNSGAFWHSKGDIKLEHALMECKERGTTNSRGEKQITIPKLWLEKQEKEAFQEQRPYWYVPFGYKGDDAVYLVKPYDHEIEMIYEMRRAREEIEKLQAELKKYKEAEKNADA
jgi:hypothetical protein